MRLLPSWKLKPTMHWNERKQLIIKAEASRRGGIKPQQRKDLLKLMSSWIFYKFLKKLKKKNCRKLEKSSGDKHPVLA